MSRTLWIALLLAPSAAFADDLISENPHFEMSVGFMGGVRSYGAAPFAIEGRTDTLAGLDEPFEIVPFEDSVVFGPRWESRVVLSPIRLTLGYQRPYPTWSGLEGTRAELPDGSRVSVEARGLKVDEVRFGLGIEAPNTRVTPFVDLVGDVSWVRAELAVDGAPASFATESFSLAGRGGLRFQTHDNVFVEAAGEYGLVGANDWSTHLMVGFAVF